MTMATRLPGLLTLCFICSSARSARTSSHSSRDHRIRIVAVLARLAVVASLRDLARHRIPAIFDHAGIAHGGAMGPLSVGCSAIATARAASGTPSLRAGFDLPDPSGFVALVDPGNGSASKPSGCNREGSPEAALRTLTLAFAGLASSTLDQTGNNSASRSSLGNPLVTMGWVAGVVMGIRG